MGGMDKYLQFLDAEQSHESPFQSTHVAKTTEDAVKQNKSIRDATGKLKNSELKEEILSENKIVNKLKKGGWKEKGDIDKETAKEYTVLHHPDLAKNHHEYYVDNSGEHFYHFYHKGKKTHIDGGLSHTFNDHLKHMNFDDKKSKRVEEEVDSNLIDMNEAALAKAGKAIVGGLSKLASHAAHHASKAVETDHKITSKLTDGIRKGLGTVGHVDLLTHQLGSTGTFSIQAGFLRRKDENGRETGPHKFNLRVRHDNWRTGQRTVRDIVGREYEKKKTQRNATREFKPRFRYGRGLTKDTKGVPSGGGQGEQQPQKQASSSKPKAYDAFAKTSDSDSTSGESKAKSKIKTKRFSAMKAPKK